MLATAGAVVVLAERPSALALAGGAVVVGAILWLGRPRGPRRRAGNRLGAPHRPDHRGLHALGQARGGRLDASPVVYFWATEIGVALALSPFVLSRPDVARRAWRVDRRPALGVALLSGFAYILVLYALTLAAVSYVAPAREISVLVGTALGVGVLREGDPRRRLACAAAIVVGILALPAG